MNLFKDILITIKELVINPEKEWIRIKNNNDSGPAVFRKIAIPLIALLSVSNLFFALITNTFDTNTAIIICALIFITESVSVVATTYIIDELVPFFDGTKNRDNAYKLIIYSSIPYWTINIIVAFLPFLSVFRFVSLYGFYLLWKGIELVVPILQEKRLNYTLTCLISIFLSYILLIYARLQISEIIIRNLQF